ncbi:MAG: aminotransferase class I/II-fold pyridoxal phosphate-dependent enzyme [Phascolarctobacterium sp.]|nr:aminotransferase class I/II-fold pyridoxal phosphate-dependent enzyme [Phascolarctobacterium sp.]
MDFAKQSVAMPLVEAMLKYKHEDVYPLHTPGHKGGRGMERLLRQEMGASVAMDVSLMSELDDIHEPESYIKEAQDLAARTYGSDACFWCVNGTSQAIHAMLMTALNPGEKLLLPRNAHRSVAGGLILGGIEAVYLQPEYSEEFGLMLQVTPAAIEATLAADSSIKAVLLTSPNYYGVAADVQAIADICHAHGAVLLVDEAHGPHLGFSEALPPSALQGGADACAQSTHKILGAMTQCSMLQVQGARLDLQRAVDVMSILTTTSPNYLLMASLDAARAQVQAHGAEMAEAAVGAAGKLRAVCRAHAGLKVLEEADCGGLRLDSTKVTVNFASWGYTGVEVGEALRRARVAVELVDAQNVLFLVTHADVTSDYDAALARIDAVLSELERHKREPLVAKTIGAVPVTSSAMKLRDVFYAPKRAVSLEAAVGCVCGEQVSFYPPGIPVLLPGEVITREIVEYCKAMKQLGLPVSGPADSSLDSIRVVE